MSKIEYVETLIPPDFEPSGIIKPVKQAVNDGDWLGAMNLWIVRPDASLLYQQRPMSGWEPGKLDGSVAGYYCAGERGLDGLREAREELGKNYDPKHVTHIGRRLNVGVDDKDRERKTVIDIFMIADDSPLSSFSLDPVEVPAIAEIPIDDLLTIFANPDKRITVYGMTCSGERFERIVSQNDFTHMWDNYHVKIAQIAKRFLSGERIFLY